MKGQKEFISASGQPRATTEGCPYKELAPPQHLRRLGWDREYFDGSRAPSPGSFVQGFLQYQGNKTDQTSSD